jgi:hypothetical protein
MYAAVNGRADFVRLLLASGAKPDALDSKGRTALLLTATYGDYPDVIKLLLGSAANGNIHDSRGRTAGAIAAARGNTETAALLGGAHAATGEAIHLPEPKEAVQASLKLLTASMLSFNKRTGCISCHQDGLGRIVTAAAREHGFQLDPAVDEAQAARINGAVHGGFQLHQGALKNPELMKQVPLIEMEEVTTAYCWMISGIEAQRQPKSDELGAMTMVLARQQRPTGAWGFVLPRVPMQSSPFTYTALAVRCVRAYGPDAYSAEVAERIERARKWLSTTPATDNESRVFRLLGLKWADAGIDEIQKCVSELKAGQQPDGGWSQLPNLKSDAYATGEALYALHTAGEVAVTDTVYQRGIQYLLRNQDEDGSWFVNKRALPANNYFNAGFPHGESQYSSFNGTCWATMALLQAIDRTSQVSSAR